MTWRLRESDHTPIRQLVLLVREILRSHDVWEQQLMQHLQRQPSHLPLYNNRDHMTSHVMTRQLPVGVYSAVQRKSERSSAGSPCLQDVRLRLAWLHERERKQCVKDHYGVVHHTTAVHHLSEWRGFSYVHVYIIMQRSKQLLLFMYMYWHDNTGPHSTRICSL